MRILFSEYFQCVSVPDDAEWPGKANNSMKFIWSMSSSSVGSAPADLTGALAGGHSSWAELHVSLRSLMVHPAQGKNLPCVPGRSFDNKPCKRVYYENTALLISWKQWIWIYLNVAFLSALKTWINYKYAETICTETCGFDLSALFKEKKIIDFGLVWTQFWALLLPLGCCKSRACQSYFMLL